MDSMVSQRGGETWLHSSRVIGLIPSLRSMFSGASHKTNLDPCGLVFGWMDRIGQEHQVLTFSESLRKQRSVTVAAPHTAGFHDPSAATRSAACARAHQTSDLGGWGCLS